MKKESEKFIDSNIMEGIVSVRAVVESGRDGTNDRKIERLLYAESKVKTKAKELSWLRFLSSDLGFPLEIVPDAQIDALAVGNTHGGILALCSDRTIPPLSAAEAARA